MILAYVIQIKMSVNQWLGSFLDQTQVFLLGLIDVFNKAENEIDFKVYAHAHKKQGVYG